MIELQMCRNNQRITYSILVHFTEIIEIKEKKLLVQSTVTEMLLKKINNIPKYQLPKTMECLVRTRRTLDKII